MHFKVKEVRIQACKGRWRVLEQEVHTQRCTLKEGNMQGGGALRGATGLKWGACEVGCGPCEGAHESAQAIVYHFVVQKTRC